MANADNPGLFDDEFIGTYEKEINVHSGSLRIAYENEFYPWEEKFQKMNISVSLN